MKRARLKRKGSKRKIKLSRPSLYEVTEFPKIAKYKFKLVKKGMAEFKD